MADFSIKWEIEARDGLARAAVLRTRRSVIETPVFMPVGTLGSVKGIRHEALESSELEAKIILANAYHLWLRPGIEILRDCGGLHNFNGWTRSLLSDSGGFQVWSLGPLRKVTEEGVAFRSHIDGSPRFLSPEISMDIQAAIGSDIVMVFDECVDGKADHNAARQSLELTARWAERSRQRFNTIQSEGFDTGATPPANGLSGNQALFGIVQGAMYEDLRRESLKRTVDIGFDGYAIGGLSVGEEKERMYETLRQIAPLMPENAPRYLMGVGTPLDMLEAIEHGVDMFDCVLPTRTGRNGLAWTSRGRLNIKLSRWTKDTMPLDENCGCSVCSRYTRAYLRHLYSAGEMLAAILLTHHNLYFYLDTLKRVRQSIRSGYFQQFRREFAEAFASGV
jgi:queuine tRNA-ribosyltransferase